MSRPNPDAWYIMNRAKSSLDSEAGSFLVQLLRRAGYRSPAWVQAALQKSGPLPSLVVPPSCKDTMTPDLQAALEMAPRDLGCQERVESGLHSKTRVLKLEEEPVGEVGPFRH